MQLSHGFNYELQDLPKGVVPIAQTNLDTVVGEYVPAVKKSDAYQSEAELEAELIKMLQDQGYGYLQIHSEAELVDNLRRQLEILNDIKFSDSEW